MSLPESITKALADLPANHPVLALGEALKDFRQNNGSMESFINDQLNDLPADKNNFRRANICLALMSNMQEMLMKSMMSGNLNSEQMSNANSAVHKISQSMQAYVKFQHDLFEGKLDKVTISKIVGEFEKITRRIAGVTTGLLHSMSVEAEITAQAESDRLMRMMALSEKRENPLRREKTDN